MTATPTPGLPELYTFEEVSAEYKISLRTLSERAKAKEFEHTRYGNSRYFTAEQLQAFLASLKVSDGLESVRARRTRQQRRSPRRTATTPRAGAA
jgi:hypothetical protein